MQIRRDAALRLFAVITAWADENNRAYTIVKLNENRDIVGMESIYLGRLSQVEMLRSWLTRIERQLEMKQRATVFTNHKAAQTSGHTADFTRINCIYSKRYRHKYSQANWLALEIIQKEIKEDG